MFKATRMMPVLIGLLLHNVALADNEEYRDWSKELIVTLTDAEIPAMSASLPREHYQVESFDELEFRDSSAVGRVSKLRSVSLLTLAKFKRSRLFIGVNNRGWLGVHFSPASKSNDRCLEVARMPYLRKETRQ